MADGDSLNRTQKLNSMFGSRAILSFGAVDQEDELFDEYFYHPEKKRRLSSDQIQFLEKSFDADNKLEPERRIQIANELGLKPRQIAIWFQNRRARWTTRQLETSYETLHASYMSLKSDYDNLLKENEKLKAKVLHLKHNGLTEDIGIANVKLCCTKELSETMPNEFNADIISQVVEPRISEEIFKNEEQSSAKSDITDELQNGEDDWNGELLHTDYMFHKFEDAHCPLPANSFHYEVPVEDYTFGFWSY